MYLTPIVYPLSQISPKWQFVMAFNPMAPVIEAFRHAFTGAGTVNLTHNAISAAVTMLVIAVGLTLFSRVEKNFMDTV